MSTNFHDKLKNNVCKIICTEGYGTGFLISDRLILTAFHVLDDCDKIKVVFVNNKIFNASLHRFIDEKYKALDIALLELDEPITHENINIIDCTLAPKTHWISRGYPKSKSDNGENLIHDDNYINDQLKELKNGKVDLNLDLHQKLTTYNGLSGAPLIVNENIVGIINSQLDENGTAKELNGLSIKYYKDLLKSVNINVKYITNNSSNIKIDTPSHMAWSTINPKDRIRNLKDKLKAVCHEISDGRIGKYSRDINLGRVELQMYDEREITSIKYIIFEVCQDELISFYETNQYTTELSIDEVKSFLLKYFQRAKHILEDKKKDNYYPIISDDLITKIILDLIDECYLSFDKDGIYE